jgi:formylglycine-generating enzyme required for sulfatase activity
MCFVSCPDEFDADEFDWQRFSANGMYAEYVNFHPNGRYKEQALARINADMADASRLNVSKTPDDRELVTLTNGVTKSPEPGDVFRDKFKGVGAGPEMVVIEPGAFMMGAPDGADYIDDGKGPERLVDIPYSFAIGKHEITWGTWHYCVSDGVCRNQGTESAGGDNGWGKGDRPVIEISWMDAQDIVRWLTEKTGHNYRLPSEAEWEFVAQAGNDARFSWGDLEPTCERGKPNSANFDCQNKRTEPVGFSEPNPFGVFDMDGNIAEWVEDCYHDYGEQHPSDGSAFLDIMPCSRVYRGGGWNIPAANARATLRQAAGRETRSSTIGVRVIREIRR